MNSNMPLTFLLGLRTAVCHSPQRAYLCQKSLQNDTEEKKTELIRGYSQSLSTMKLFSMSSLQFFLCKKCHHQVAQAQHCIVLYWDHNLTKW